MSVRPKRDMALICDHCGNEIRRGRSVVFGQVGTFIGFDRADDLPLMQAVPKPETRQYHRDCFTDDGTAGPAEGRDTPS